LGFPSLFGSTIFTFCLESGFAAFSFSGFGCFASSFPTN
jgi:hypothetical protein